MEWQYSEEYTLSYLYANFKYIKCICVNRLINNPVNPETNQSYQSYETVANWFDQLNVGIW